MSKKIIAPKIAYVCRALLAGEVLTMIDGYKRWNITNLSREISRQIEGRFDVIVSKDKVEFKTEMGLPGWYFRYRLNSSESNENGIQEIHEYLSQYFPSKKEEPSPITQVSLF